MARKGTKIDRKKQRQIKSGEIAALVVSAIQDLRETKGTTSKKIAGYISYTSNIPEKRIKRQVEIALKRAVKYGILQRYRGTYFLPAGDELDRANRIAMRFARLPTPALLLDKSKTNFAYKTKDRKRPRGISNRAHKSKKVESDRTPSVSTTSSLMDKILDHVAPVIE